MPQVGVAMFEVGDGSLLWGQAIQEAKGDMAIGTQLAFLMTVPTREKG